MKRLLGSTILALILTLSMASTAFAASAFTDVPETHWAYAYIQQAYEAGWVNGMSQNIYAPSDSLTRAQFLKMVDTAFYSADLEAAAVPGESPWYTSTWTVAQQHNLASGTSMSKLSDLTAQISRYDMAQVISNTVTAKGITASVASSNLQSDIQDWSTIPQSYRNAVSSAYALGILTGKNGSFAGQDTMTRAEAATVLCRMNSVITGTNNTQTPSTTTPSTTTPTTTTPTTTTPSTTTPSTTTPTTTTPTTEELIAEVVRLVNVERAKEGLPALGTFDSLTEAAAIRAPELITLFSHTRPDGTTCFTALDKTGANKNAYTSGENIAAGYATAAQTVEQWMNSPGHRANILNKNFTHIGVGYAKGGTYGHYWVQMFVGTNTVPSTTTPSTTNPSTTTPSTTTPSTTTPSTTTPSTTTPSTTTPSTTTPSTTTPSTTTPSTTTPSTTTPSTSKPSTTTPSTTTPSTTTPSTQSSKTPEQLAAEVVELVNKERAKEGLAPLGTYDSLTKAAQIRAPELPTLFSHTRPDGSSCFTALDETGAKKGAYTWGENCAAGSTTAEGAMEQWMNSPGHRANILNKDFTHIGVAYCKSSSGYGSYWVQMFIGTNSVPDSSSAQTPSSTTPSTQTPSTQTPSTQTPSTQTPSQNTSKNGLLFSRPTITLSPGQGSTISVLDNDYRSVSGATFINESPDLLRVSGTTVSAISGKTGTGYVTAEFNGQKARLTVRVIPSEDQIALSCLFLRVASGSYGTTELYVFSSSKFYGQDIDVSWSVDNPSILTLDERTSSSGNPSVRFTSTGVAGEACITCRVTMSDGSTAEEYCFVSVSDR